MLQRTYGNRHVQRLAEHGRLRISRASDPAEREAGRVARAVAGAATPARPEASSAHPAPDIDGSTERAIRQARGGGQPLPGWVRGPMEQQLGADLDGVRLHTDARADQLSQSLQALAFTTGGDIFFRRGGYAPGSTAGRHVLAHELAHVAQQQSGTGQPTIQRFIASVNHGLRDPKGKPKDDYGTYRSLDVAVAAGGGEVYTGPNTAERGGRLDQLAGEAKGIKLLKEKEDLYLVGHGSKNLIGIIGPEKVAKAVVNITPETWEGQIFSLNCWSAYRTKDAPSALENLRQSLADKGRAVSVSGPIGRSIRHRDWLGERNSPVGMRAVVAELKKEDEEPAYDDIMKSAREEAGIKTDPEDAFDAALSERFKEKVDSGAPIGVRKKAKFATKWGRAFQANLVKKLETDERLKKAIDEGRVLFGRSGLYESIASVARELSPGEEKVISVGRAEEKVISAVRAEEKVTSVDRAEDSPRETARRPEDAGEGRSWSWLSFAGVGLIGLAALGAGLALIKLRRR